LGAIVGICSLDVGPVVSSKTSVWFDGRLDNRADLLTRFTPATPGVASLSDAALTLAVYDRRGADFAGELNGDFAVAVLDESQRRLILARDIMASQSLYYCVVQGVVLFASQIKSVLADRRVTAAPDEDGLAELVLDYWCDDERTCFKGIYSVPPGHAVIVSPDRIERRAHWTFDPARQIRYRAFEDYCDHFRTVFAEAVRRRLRGASGVAVAVSGGLDSSSIFCQAAQLQRQESPHFTLLGVSMTFPAGTAADERGFLEEIERSYDMPITKLPISEYHYLDHVDCAVTALDTPGQTSASDLEIARTARRAGCGILLSGFFGDQVLSDRGYMVDLVRGRRWLDVRRHLRNCAAWSIDVEPDFFRREFWSHATRGLPPRWLVRSGRRLLRHLRAKGRYPPWFTEAFRRRAIERSAQRFKHARRFASFHAEQLYRHVTAGHYINSVRCERAAARIHGVDVRYPFRDRDLVAFLMAIPGDIVNRRGVPTGLLRQALAGILPDAICHRRSKADFTALENRAMRRDVIRLEALLRSQCLAAQAGFVDSSALAHLPSTFDRLSDNDDAGSPGWLLTDLAGLEIWLRRYFSGAPVN
jgi:asparagine synthase (glutamine-hydrolysing)